MIRRLALAIFLVSLIIVFAVTIFPTKASTYSAQQQPVPTTDVAVSERFKTLWKSGRGGPSPDLELIQDTVSGWCYLIVRYGGIVVGSGSTGAGITNAGCGKPEEEKP